MQLLHPLISPKEGTMSLLTMKNISKAFYGKPALEEVDLRVEAGQIHALLGENGAGKTTLMNILYGLYERDEGEIYWKDEPLEIKSPKDAIDCHIGMVHQHFMLVPNLTVAENITLGLKSPGHPFPRKEEINQKLLGLSEQYNLALDPSKKISSLSVGEQQRVEIMKLLYREAELLILDEPTAVLTPQETLSFFAILKKLKEQGHSVIIITHRIQEVMAIADEISVLRDGRLVKTVDARDVDERQLAIYMINRELKEHPERQAYTGSKKGEGLFLKDVGLWEDNMEKLNGISLSIPPGEIVGIAGVDGNGQKELAEVILGMRRITEGSIRLNGLDLSSMPVKERKMLGLAYISDDRHHDSLLMSMDLPTNMILKAGKNPSCQRGMVIRWKQVADFTEKMVEEFKVKTPGLEVPIRYLSGGNQQKIILARELDGEPTLIVAFQPTRGLDIGAAEFIQQKLLEKRMEGCSILLISADLEEIRALSDRIHVMYKGEFLGEMANDQNLDLTAIGLWMAGKKVGGEGK